MSEMDFERIQPSFFEITVAMAFDHFRNETNDINFAIFSLNKCSKCLTLS